MSKKKLIPHWHYVELYKSNIYYHLGWTPKEFEEYAAKEYGRQGGAPLGDGNCLEVVTPQGGHGIVIWIRKKTDHPALAHEAVHAAYWILAERGIDIRDSQGETFAYLVEFLIRKSK